MPSYIDSLEQLRDVLARSAALAPAVEAASRAILTALLAGKKLLTCGI